MLCTLKVVIKNDENVPEEESVVISTDVRSHGALFLKVNNKYLHIYTYAS